MQGDFMMNDYTQAFLKIIEDNKKIIEKKIEKNPDYIIELMQHSIKCGSNILLEQLQVKRKKKNSKNNVFLFILLSLNITVYI